MAHGCDNDHDNDVTQIIAPSLWSSSRHMASKGGGADVDEGEAGCCRVQGERWARACAGEDEGKCQCLPHTGASNAEYIFVSSQNGLYYLHLPETWLFIEYFQDIPLNYGECGYCGRSKQIRRHRHHERPEV